MKVTIRSVRKIARENSYDVQRMRRHGISWFRFTPVEAGSTSFSVLVSELEGMTQAEIDEFILSEIARVEEEAKQRQAMLSALGMTESDVTWSGARRKCKRARKKKPMAREKGIQNAARAHGYEAHIEDSCVWFEPMGIKEDMIREALSFVIHWMPGERPRDTWMNEIETQAAKRRKAVEEVIGEL